MAPLSSLRRAAATTLAALAAAAACLTLAPAHAAAPPADTGATLTWNGTVLRLKVTSPKASCDDGRRVFVQMSNGFTGAFTGRTNDDGVYRFEDGPPYGTVRGFVARTPSCRAAQSNAVTHEPQPTRSAPQARTSATITRISPIAYRVKVDSPDPDCRSGRKVSGFEFVPGFPFAGSLTGTTNANGVAVLQYPDERVRRGFSNFKTTAFVRPTTACAVGQSNVLPVTNPPV